MVKHVLRIPVNNYYYQLLNTSLGPSPYTVNPRKSIDKIIMASFLNKSNKPLKIISNGCYVYELEIPNRWFKEYKLGFISEQSIEDLIETLDRKFKQEMYTYIDAVIDFKEMYEKAHKVKLVAKMKDAAVHFLTKKGFSEDELKFETVKKGYQRYKQQGKSLEKYTVKKIFPTSVPNIIS